MHPVVPIRPSQLAAERAAGLRLGHSPEPPDDFGRLAGVLRRRGRLIILGLVLVLSAAACFSLVWPRTYQSSALIIIDRRTGNADNSLALLSQLGQASQVETEIELLQSRHVIERVVDQLDLHVSVERHATTSGTSASFLGRIVARARGVLRPPRALRPRVVFPTFDATAEAAPAVYSGAVTPQGALELRDTEGRVVARVVGQEAAVLIPGITLSVPDSVPWQAFDLRVAPFAEAVSATRNRVRAARKQRDADLVEVDCEGRTPEGARDLCSGVLTTYLGLRKNLRRAEATATAQFLREQVDLLGGRLAAAEDSLETYRSRYGAVALDERAAEEVRQLARVTAQRDQLYAEQSALSALIDEIQSGQAGAPRYRDLASFPKFLENQAVTQLLANLVTLENQRSDLRLRRSETSTEITTLNGRIAEIEQQLLSIAMSYRRALDMEVRSLNDALQASGARLNSIPQRQMEAVRLERQASGLGDLYTLLKTRLREAEVAEGVNVPNVSVVDQPSLPVRPARPKLGLNLVIGSVLGLTFGLVLAFVREQTDHSIRERRDVERQFGLPVLAMTPRLPGANTILPIPTLRRRGDAGAREDPPGPVAGKGRAVAVLRQERPRGEYRMTDERQAALESFRALATDLRFATSHLNGGVLALTVTSAVSGEGKTFVACNLALARASQGARTLIIDGDIRGGGASKFFGLPAAAPGLSDILAASPGMNPDDGVWKGTVNRTDLWVIPPGSSSLYSARVFEYPRFAHLLEQAKLQFDLVVIDTPPINLVTDAAPIAAVSDAVLLVVRNSITTWDGLELTLERLGRARSYVVGAVLNDVEPRRHYGARYGYSKAV